MSPDIHAQLRAQLPQSKLAEDLNAVLSENSSDIELEGRTVRVPAGTSFEIVSLSCQANAYAVGFRDHFRAVLALGGVTSVDFGIVTAAICFATLWYNRDLKLITVDFSSDLR